jgi:hypothetical protein
MKKVFFYGAVGILIATNALLQMFGAMRNDLNENLFLILICILLLNMLLVFVEGWKFRVNIWLLVATPVAILFMMGISVFVFLLSYGITAFPLPVGPLVIGVRMTALIWSFVVFSLGFDKLETSVKEDLEKIIKEIPNAE